ncbi:MAG: sulfotransferase, partial [Calditrichaeota bacterium]|nr:sulfotransferase [Calditrichota bacterium]
MSILIGITFSEWKKLLAENNCRISPKYLPRLLPITMRSLMNSRENKKEVEAFEAQIRETRVEKAPVFILGHWRSGTTLLQNYFSLDKQFAYPNLFQVYNPNSFLHLEPIIAEKMANAPAEKRPMDNVRVTFDSPAEDEFALAILSRCSPLLAWVFPKRQEFYDRYLTMQDVSAEEFARWKNAFQLFVRKLTLKNKKQLILKSPPHTCRISLLLDMYPDAKFIHLYRNPFDVF